MSKKHKILDLETHTYFKFASRNPNEPITVYWEDALNTIFYDSVEEVAFDLLRGRDPISVHIEEEDVDD